MKRFHSLVIATFWALLISLCGTQHTAAQGILKAQSSNHNASSGATEFRWVVVNGAPPGGLVLISADGATTSVLAPGVTGYDVVVDANGDFFVASPLSGLLRVTPTGSVSQLAAIPGQAIGVARDAAGNFIVADNVFHSIWRVSPGGSKVHVGNYPVTVANQLEDVRVAVNADGNYVIAHTNGARANVAVMTPAGVVTPIAITGAVPSMPGGLTFDESGNYMVMDYAQSAIFRITPSGSSTLFAQSPAFCCPSTGLARDPASGEYGVAVRGSNSVQKVSDSGAAITQLAGGNPPFASPTSIAVIRAGAAPGPGPGGSTSPRWVAVNSLNAAGLVQISADGTNSSVVAPSVQGNDVVVAPNGDFIVAGASSGLRRVTPSGAVSQLATIPGQAIGVARDSFGNFIVAENSFDAVWRVSPDGSTVKVANYPVDVTNQLESIRVIVDRNGNYVIAHSNGGRGNLAVISPAGVVTPVAMTGAVPTAPSGLTLDENGNYMVLDFSQSAIFRITPAGLSTVFAQDSAALCCNATGLARDPITGEYAVSLNFSKKIQKVSADGSTITTLAAGPLFGFVSAIAVIPPATAPVTIDSNPSGAVIPNAAKTIFVSGAGCEAGSYNGPVTLNWVVGAACTVQFQSPQPIVKDSPAPVIYSFSAWEDGETANPRTFTATGAPSLLKASFTEKYLLSVAVNPPAGGTATGGGYYEPGVAAQINVTPNPIYRFLNWNGPVASTTSAATTIVMNGPHSVTANLEPKPVAGITLSGLNQTYTGTPRAVGAVTDPPGLSVSFTYNGSPAAPVHAGSYPVLAHVTDPDYRGSTSGTLIVQKAALQVKANSLSRVYDSPNPELTATYSGFANGESFGTAVTGFPSLTTAATQASLPGDYPIAAAQGSLFAPNYDFVFVNGTLTVTPTGSAPLSGAGCNGAYTGTFGGNVSIQSGQTCAFVNGSITGNVVLSGGRLILSNGTANGNIQGHGEVSITSGSSVKGNVVLSGGGLSLSGGAGIGGQITLTGGATLALAGGSVGKSVTIDGGGAFSIGPSVTTGGSVSIQSVAATAGFGRVCGAVVNGNLAVAYNGAAVQLGSGDGSCAGNAVSGQLQVERNAGAVTVFNNGISGNLQCSGNSSVTGAGNTARRKQGQCSAF